MMVKRTPFPSVPGPWFREHPRVALGISIALAAGVFAIRLAVGGTTDALTPMFVLPVALVAIAFGARAGLAAGVVTAGLIVVWVVGRDITLTPLGWASRFTPTLLLGPLVGSASDALRAAALRERDLAAAAVLHREAAEINDNVVQGLSVAKWMLEAGETERGLAALEQAMTTAQALVAKQLGADSPLPGDLRRSMPTAGVER